MNEHPPIVRLHLWLDCEEGLYFGAGRAMLLHLIDKHGSLKKAAEELGMSYRAAWGKLKKSEEVLGAPLIERAESRSGGYKLTPFARELTIEYTAWFESVELEAKRKGEEIFQRVFRTYTGKAASPAPKSGKASS
jgi:molybdate transport system regulatory protein